MKDYIFGLRRSSELSPSGTMCYPKHHSSPSLEGLQRICFWLSPIIFILSITCWYCFLEGMPPSGLGFIDVAEIGGLGTDGANWMIPSASPPKRLRYRGPWSVPMTVEFAMDYVSSILECFTADFAAGTLDRLPCLIPRSANPTCWGLGPQGSRAFCSTPRGLFCCGG